MKHQKGSALLIVLSLAGLISIFMMHTWFVMSLQYDIVLQRALQHKNFYTTEKMLNMGLVLVSKQFGQISQRVNASKNPISLDLSHIFKDGIQDRSGVQEIVLVAQCDDTTLPDTLLVRALRLENNVCTCHLQCLLRKIAEAKQSGSTQKDKGMHFVASHFTVSVGV